MEAPIPLTPEPSKKDLENANFSNEEFKAKLNGEIYNIMVGFSNEYLVMKVYNKSNPKKTYISFYTYEDLKNISKSMRYFEDINDVLSFLEGKGIKK